MAKILITSFLILFSFCAFAQSTVESLEKIGVVYTGESTFSESYEILINRKKIIYLPSVINYLDIKGVKGPYSRKIGKKDWEKLVVIINKFDFNQLDSLNKENLKVDRLYLDLTFLDQKTKKYLIQFNEVPDYLNKLLEIIRKNE